jgi:hypothetical protein
MIIDKTICDWCGMAVYRDAEIYTEEDSMRRHKLSYDPMLRCLHQKFFEKNSLEPLGVTTV